MERETIVTDEAERVKPKHAEVAEEEMDVSSLPADVVGTINKAPVEFKEEPYIYLAADDEQVKLCMSVFLSPSLYLVLSLNDHGILERHREFFDLHPSFPTSSLLVRNASGAPLRSIYFTSSLVRSLLLSNTYSRMRLISCGVKVFTRQDATSKDPIYRCKWRVVSEGLEVMRPFMGPKRIIQASIDTLKLLMGTLNILIADVHEVAFVQRLNEMESGSCVLEVTASGEGVAYVEHHFPCDLSTLTRSPINRFEQKLILPLWKSKISCSLMVEKVEKRFVSFK